MLARPPSLCVCSTSCSSEFLLDPTLSWDHMKRLKINAFETSTSLASGFQPCKNKVYHSTKERLGWPSERLEGVEVVNIKPLPRWSRCDRDCCTYCRKSSMRKWRNCTFMHSGTELSPSGWSSRGFRRVSPVRSSPGTKNPSWELTKWLPHWRSCRALQLESHGELRFAIPAGRPRISWTTSSLSLRSLFSRMRAARETSPSRMSTPGAPFPLSCRDHDGRLRRARAVLIACLHGTSTYRLFGSFLLLWEVLCGMYLLLWTYCRGGIGLIVASLFLVTSPSSYSWYWAFGRKLNF